MKKVNLRYITCSIIPLFFVACFTKNNSPYESVSDLSLNNQYVKSGTIEVSFNLPENLRSNIGAENSGFNLSFLEEENYLKNPNEAGFSCDILSAKSTSSEIVEAKAPQKDIKTFAPLVGFFPLSVQFKPADNEVWMQIVKDQNKIEVYKGKEVIKVISGEGNIQLAPGEYPLQHKQRNPLWYAPDEYFSKRELRVPPRGDHFRYRRGALGNYAIYPTMDFAIHSGPFWSEEVGGLKVSEADLASIFVMLNVGTPIIVK